VFTISAGVMGMPLPAFVAGSVVGRGGRFFLVAGLIRLGGEDISKRLRKYVDLIGWVTLALAIIAIVIYKLNGAAE
jgi:membrane protein DedA with SNARE-associated domain